MSAGCSLLLVLLLPAGQCCFTASSSFYSSKSKSAGGGPLFQLSSQLGRSASGVKDMLLTWCQCRTRDYKVHRASMGLHACSPKTQSNTAPCNKTAETLYCPIPLSDSGNIHQFSCFRIFSNFISQVKEQKWSSKNVKIPLILKISEVNDLSYIFPRKHHVDIFKIIIISYASYEKRNHYWCNERQDYGPGLCQLNTLE